LYKVVSDFGKKMYMVGYFELKLIMPSNIGLTRIDRKELLYSFKTITLTFRFYNKFIQNYD